MSLLQYSLGYGKSAIVETDTFTRILAGQFYDYEEVRSEKPSDYGTGYEYVATAPNGSDPSDFVWQCIRCTWVNNKKSRLQFRENLSWTNRSQGWQ
jgi:hypothetical protein